MAGAGRPGQHERDDVASTSDFSEVLPGEYSGEEEPVRTRTLLHPCRARLLGRYEAFACRWRCAGGVCAIPAAARNPTAGNAAVVGSHQPGEWAATWEGCAGSVPAAPTLSCAESCAHGGCRMRTCTETPSAARAQTGGTRCPSCSGGRPLVPRKLAGRPAVSTAHESGRFQRVSLHKNGDR